LNRAARIAGYTAYVGEAFAKLPAEMQTWLRACAAGVNAWTAAHREADIEIQNRRLPNAPARLFGLSGRAKASS